MSGLWASGDDLLLPALHTADTAAEGPASASTADSFSSRFRCHCTSSRCRDRQASEGRGRRGRKRRGGRTERRSGGGRSGEKLDAFRVADEGVDVRANRRAAKAVHCDGALVRRLWLPVLLVIDVKER